MARHPATNRLRDALKQDDGPISVVAAPGLDLPKLLAEALPAMPAFCVWDDFNAPPGVTPYDLQSLVSAAGPISPGTDDERFHDALLLLDKGETPVVFASLGRPRYSWADIAETIDRRVIFIREDPEIHGMSINGREVSDALLAQYLSTTTGIDQQILRGAHLNVPLARVYARARRGPSVAEALSDMLARLERRPPFNLELLRRTLAHLRSRLNVPLTIEELSRLTRVDSYTVMRLVEQSGFFRLGVRERGRFRPVQVASRELLYSLATLLLMPPKSNPPRDIESRVRYRAHTSVQALVSDLVDLSATDPSYVDRFLATRETLRYITEMAFHSDDEWATAKVLKLLAGHAAPSGRALIARLILCVLIGGKKISRADALSASGLGSIVHADDGSVRNDVTAPQRASLEKLLPQALARFGTIRFGPVGIVPVPEIEAQGRVHETPYRRLVQFGLDDVVISLDWPVAPRGRRGLKAPSQIGDGTWCVEELTVIVDEFTSELEICKSEAEAFPARGLEFAHHLCSTRPPSSVDGYVLRLDVSSAGDRYRDLAEAVNDLLLGAERYEYRQLGTTPLNYMPVAMEFEGAFAKRARPEGVPTSRRIYRQSTDGRFNRLAERSGFQVARYRDHADVVTVLYHHPPNGRSAIADEVLEMEPFAVLLASCNGTADALKLHAEGVPHVFELRPAVPPGTETDGVDLKASLQAALTFERCAIEEMDMPSASLWKVFSPVLDTYRRYSLSTRFPATMRYYCAST
jgi:hypothetical protein